MATFLGDDLDDNFTGDGADDYISGAGGNDILNGAAGNDEIYGGSGNDSLIGGAGEDSLYGGEGQDTLNAIGGGNDKLFGGIGNDVYQVNTTTDNVVENSNQGTDTVRSRVSYTLDANVENLVLTGSDNINGSGNALNNRITGSSGNNNLSGGGGNDTLNGGGGNDTLTGGVDSDHFLFNTALPAAGVDTITSFVVGSDKIVLDKTVFSALETVAGNPGNPLLAGDFEVIDAPAASEAAEAGSRGDEIVYNRQTGNLFYNPNNDTPGFGAGGGRFATIVGSPNNLSKTDFLVLA